MSLIVLDKEMCVKRRRQQGLRHELVVLLSAVTQFVSYVDA